MIPTGAAPDTHLPPHTIGDLTFPNIHLPLKNVLNQVGINSGQVRLEQSDKQRAVRRREVASTRTTARDCGSGHGEAEPARVEQGWWRVGGSGGEEEGGRRPAENRRK